MVIQLLILILVLETGFIIKSLIDLLIIAEKEELLLVMLGQKAHVAVENKLYLIRLKCVIDFVQMACTIGRVLNKL
jgi:hypothetical protein